MQSMSLRLKVHKSAKKYASNSCKQKFVVVFALKFKIELLHDRLLVHVVDYTNSFFIEIRRLPFSIPSCLRKSQS
jgi:hypothetical protein